MLSGFFPLYTKLPLRKSCLGLELNVIILEKSVCVGKDLLTTLGCPSWEGRNHPWLHLPSTPACWAVRGCAVTLRSLGSSEQGGDPSPRGHPGLGPILLPSCQGSGNGSWGAGGVLSQECFSLAGRHLCSWSPERLGRGRDVCGTCQRAPRLSCLSAAPIPSSSSSPWDVAARSQHPAPPPDGCCRRVGGTSEPPRAGGPTNHAAVTRGGDISGTAQPSGPQRPSRGAGSGTGALTRPRHRFPLPSCAAPCRAPLSSTPPRLPHPGGLTGPHAVSGVTEPPPDC